jgi:hypothetical protein
MRRQGSCPGRGAAFFTLLRRAGTVTNAGPRYGPGSAAHRYALRSVRGTRLSYIRCTECGASRPIAVKAMPTIANAPDIHASAIMPVMMVADASTIPI